MNDHKSNDISGPHDTDSLLTPVEFAAYLRIGKRTFHTWKAAGRLPVPDLQIGKSLRWRRSTVDRWLASDKAKRISA